MTGGNHFTPVDDMHVEGIPGGQSPLHIVSLNQDSLGAVMGLQELVISRLENKKLLVSLSQDEYLDVLGEKGIGLGIFDQGELVAFYGALFPGESSENLGRDLQLPAGELAQVCHLEISFVRPDYRGKKLQSVLGQRIVAGITALNKYRYVCNTVGLDNYPSLRSAFSLGLHIVQLKEKYGGLMRFILLRDLLEPVVLDMDNPVSAPNTDCDYQQKLIKEEYYGFKQAGIPGRPVILYGKRISGR